MQLRRGWFKATPEQAMALLLQALPLADQPAARSCEIRAFLHDKVGKAKAMQMLSKAKVTVAQDRNGKKNKVLKYGTSLLKLRR